MTVRTFFSWALMCCGGLLAVLSGGCSLFILFTDTNWFFLAMIVGGIPCLVGIGLFYWGKKLRSPKPVKRVAPTIE